MHEMNKAIFLDRDGVINHDPGDYTKNVNEFVLLPNVLEALKALNDDGFLLILVTNQGGIAKGLYHHEDVKCIHDTFIRECEEYGVQIADIFYSPHHPDFGQSLSRKPGGLMIERACAKHQIDRTSSWMVGDKKRDVEAANAAGVWGMQIPVNGDLLSYVGELRQQPRNNVFHV